MRGGEQTGDRGDKTGKQRKRKDKRVEFENTINEKRKKKLGS